MSSYGNRFKSNYFQDTSLEELYILTENWENDFDLYLLEIEFLEQLMDTYFIKLLTYESFEVLKELQIECKKFNKIAKDMRKHLQYHLLWIVEIIEKSYHEKNYLLRGQQAFFEEEISYYLTSFKKIKYTIYGKLKNIMKAEQPKFIWKYN